MHVPPSGPKVPGLHLHSKREELLAGDDDNAGQLRQAKDEEAPTAAEYLPASQSWHGSDPLTVLYLPAAHTEQGPPSFPVAPALHVQDDTLLLAGGESESDGHVLHDDSADAPDLVEYLPDPQLLHGALPAFILYLPASHSLQGPPSLPVAPALHVQADLLSLADGD